MSNKNENKLKSVVLGRPGTAEEFCAYLQKVGVDAEFIDCTELMQRGHERRGYCETDLSNLLEGKTDVRAVYCLIMNNMDRHLFLKLARELGYETPNFIHPSAKVDPTVREKLDQNPNAGIYVFEGAEIEPNVEIDESAIIALNAFIGQGSKLYRGAFIHVGAKLGKNCKVHINTYVDGKIPDGTTIAG